MIVPIQSQSTRVNGSSILSKRLTSPCHGLAPRTSPLTRPVINELAMTRLSRRRRSKVRPRPAADTQRRSVAKAARRGSGNERIPSMLDLGGLERPLAKAPVVSCLAYIGHFGDTCLLRSATCFRLGAPARTRLRDRSRLCTDAVPSFRTSQDCSAHCYTSVCRRQDRSQASPSGRQSHFQGRQGQSDAIQALQ